MRLLAKTWLLFFLILLIAGVFRVLYLQHIEFKGDEALNLFLATRPLFHHPFPPASQASSAGFPNFPLLNYLLLPITIISLYPPTISLIIALINILVIGGFFLLFTKYHGKLAGFLASCILALSPWAILYSRKIWAQDFLLPLCLPFFLSVYKILEGQKKYWFVFGLSSTLLLQIHQLALLLPVAIFIILRIKRTNISWVALFSGTCIGLIPAIPYFWYLARDYCFTCQNTQAIVTRFSYHDVSIFLRPLQIISQGNFHTEFGPDFAVFATKFHSLYIISKISYLAYLLLPVSIVVFWIKNSVYRIFLSAFLGILLVMFALGIEPLMHYVIILLPLSALFVATLLAMLIKSREMRIIGVSLVILYFVSLIAIDSGFFLTLLQKGGLAGDYGAGYASEEKARTTRLEKFKNEANYQELRIAEPVPPGLMKGYMPVGSMLFPHSQLEETIYSLEKQYEKNPKNPLTFMKILSFYTPHEYPTWQEVLLMREKARAKSVYQPIYQDILNRYLSQNYKNLYETTDFFFTYPQHWEKIVEENSVSFSSDELKLTIISSFHEFPVLMQDNQQMPEPSLIARTSTKRLICYDATIWCGTTYGPIKIGAQYYLFTAVPLGNQQRILSEKILDEILSSVTPIYE